MYGTVIFKGVNQSEYHSLYIQSSLHINLNLLFFKKHLQCVVLSSKPVCEIGSTDNL